MKTKMMILIVALFSVVTTIRAVTYPSQPYVSKSTTVHVTTPAVAPTIEPFRNVGGTAPLPICQSSPRRNPVLGDEEEECRHTHRTWNGENWVCDDCHEILGTGGGTPGGGNNNENITPIGDHMPTMLVFALMLSVIIAIRHRKNNDTID